ncbi:MAG: hypothetical protein ACRC62_22860 [Microcoleus sp.]
MADNLLPGIGELGPIAKTEANASARSLAHRETVTNPKYFP